MREKIKKLSPAEIASKQIKKLSPADKKFFKEWANRYLDEIRKKRKEKLCQTSEQSNN